MLEIMLEVPSVRYVLREHQGESCYTKSDEMKNQQKDKRLRKEPVKVNSSKFDDDYVLERGRDLGIGMSGMVMTAIDKLTGIERAVKFIEDSPSARNEVLCQTVANQQLSAGESSVVPILDVYSEEFIRDLSEGRKRFLIVVMELLEGGDLFDELCRQPCKRFCEKDMKILMRQLATLVKEMHSDGICHGDIKIENILLKNKRSLDDVKLTDFGFSTMEQPTGIDCTVPYAAPELVRAIYSKQITNKTPPHTNAVDMWALGVTLYICLAGKFPFVDRRRRSGQELTLTVNLRQAILNGKFTLIGNGLNVISRECKDVIRGLLTVDPRERLTAAQLLEHPWLKQNQFIKCAKAV